MTPIPSDASQAVPPSALKIARDALTEIALAGMSGSGQESEEGMRDWHARRAWDFIAIAARAKTRIDAAIAQDRAARVQAEPVRRFEWPDGPKAMAARVQGAGEAVADVLDDLVLELRSLAHCAPNQAEQRATRCKFWIENIQALAARTIPQAAEVPAKHCSVCGDTGIVTTGFMTHSEGGVEYSEPIRCVDDCPACAIAAAPTPTSPAPNAEVPGFPQEIPQTFHDEGEIIRSTDPLTGSPIAWRCDAGGVPGTWRAVAFVQEKKTSAPTPTDSAAKA